MRGRTTIEKLGLKAEWGVSLGSPSTPTLPGLALPVLRGCRDNCKLQITGQGTSKLVGAVDGPEGPGQRAGRVLGGMPAVPGDLWGQMGMQECLGAIFCPPPALPVPLPRWCPPFEPLWPVVLEAPVLVSGWPGPGHSLSSR